MIYYSFKNFAEFMSVMTRNPENMKFFNRMCKIEMPVKEEEPAAEETPAEETAE